MMRRVWSILLIMFFVWSGGIRGTSVWASESTVIDWDVHGTIRDATTKRPIAGALVIVLLDDASTMNDGSNPEQTDYPDLPRSSPAGTFSAKAMFSRSPSKSRPDHLDVMVLAPDYRTERFRFAGDQLQLVEQGEIRTIAIPEINITNYQNLSAGATLVASAEAAERLARLAIERNNVDTTGLKMVRPESVQSITWKGRPAWRVSFAPTAKGTVKVTKGKKVVRRMSFVPSKPVKGQQLVILIDATTGKIEIGAGE